MKTLHEHNAEKQSDHILRAGVLCPQCNSEMMRHEYSGGIKHGGLVCTPVFCVCCYYSGIKYD